MIRGLRNILAAAVLVIGGAAFGEGGAMSAQELGAAVAPFVNEDTMVVVHVDIGQIDTAAFEKMLSAAMDEQKVAVDPADRKEFFASREPVEHVLARLKELGGRHFFFVVAFNSRARRGREPMREPLGLFLVEPGGDAGKLAEFLKSDEAGKAPAIAVNERVVAISDMRGGMNPATIQAAERPEFAKGLEATSGAVQVVAALSPGVKAAINAMLPPFPEELGGGTLETATAGLEYVSMGATLPPEPSVTMKIHADTAESAAKMNGVVSQMLDAARAHLAEAQKRAPAGASRGEAVLLASMLEAAVPKLEGSDIVVSLDAGQVKELAGKVVPAMIASRQRARQIMAMANVRQGVMAVTMYRQEHGDEMPEKLEDLGKYVSMPNTLVNPADPKKRPFEYKHWTKEELKTLLPTDMPVMWTVVDDEKAAIPVGFMDGHVEIMANKAALEKQLAALAEQLKAKRAGP